LTETDKIDSQVLAVLSQRELVPAIWLPDPRIREERELARFRLHLVKHKSALKNRVHSTLINFGKPCPVTDLFGVAGRELLARLQVPEPWRGNITASVELIDNLEGQIAEINRKLREGHTDHPYIPLLMSTPGVGWVLAFTIAAEIGAIERFSSPEAGRLHRPLPARQPVGRRRPARPALKARAHVPALGAARGHHARAQAPRLRGAHQRNKRRLGKQRGAKVAQIDIARRLAHAIWRMLSRNRQFAPRGAAVRLAA
jgi:transposase